MWDQDVTGQCGDQRPEKFGRMIREKVSQRVVWDLCRAIPYLLRLPTDRAQIDYDRETDVLYISLGRPQKATDTVFMEEEGILLRYRGKMLVGMTVLDASTRGRDGD